METLPCAIQLQEPQQPHPQLVNLSMEASLGENVVSIPKELILISLVSQEQSLYNPKHPNYRSTKIKDEKWLEIGSNVGWSDVQCKSKWKAMRDQYCRELKRAKACAKAVKWKYFKELEFLRPYALARNYRGRSGQNANGIVSTVTPITLPLGNSFSSNSSSQNLNLSGSIKIEDASATTLLDNCSFSSSSSTVDKKPSATFMTSHMGAVLQQPQPESNWNYLTDAGGGATPSIIVQCGAANTTTVVDTLYNEIVNAVNQSSSGTTATASTASATAHATAHNQAAANAEEEDDDPIHTFLNMESYFEKELISLIQQEDMIYNYSNENYRNAKLKMEVWEEIARKLKKSVRQCRLKWKALRDQYAREHKRLRTLMHIDATSRWKHYDSLSFLQKYIQQKTLEGDPQLSMLLPKHDPVRELEEHMGHSHSPPTQQQSTMESSSSSQLSMSALPHLTGPHKAELANSMPEQQQEEQQQQQQQASELCVATYDDMDIENYINGGDAHHDDEEEDDDDEEMESTTAVEQTQQSQEQHVVSYDHEEGPVYMEVQRVSSSMAKQDQLSEGASNMEHQQLQSTGDFQQKLEIQTPTTPRYQNAANTPSSASTSRYHSAPITPNKPSHVEFPPINGHNPGEDDEIGAFFKAVAMKIRNAQLEPVAFTELQIDILRVINEALRNH